MHLTSISPEYLAGFIDADGNIGIAKAQTRGISPDYRPSVRISNTDRPLLLDVKKSYGGWVMLNGRVRPRCKTTYQIAWVHRKVEPLLLQVLPYLRIKRERARLLLQFIYYKKSVKRERRVGHRGGNLPLRASDIEIREAFFQKMKELNRRGVRT